MIRTFLLSGLIGVAALLGTTAGTSAQSPPANSKASAATGSEAERENARQIAQDWLTAIDHGDITAGFRALSASASTKVDQAKWQSAIEAQRAQFGAPKGRQFQRMHLFRKGENGRDQDFYLADFHSTSVEAGVLREVVRLVKDADGTWLAAGYTVDRRQRGVEDEEGEDEN